MINTAPIREASRTCPGDMVALSKAQLDALLDEVDDGQAARRRLRILTANPAGITRVSGAR